MGGSKGVDGGEEGEGCGHGVMLSPAGPGPISSIIRG